MGFQTTKKVKFTGHPPRLSKQHVQVQHEGIRYLNIL